MYASNPILIGQTPDSGWRFVVTDDPGGMSGYILRGQSGPPVTIEISTDGGQVWASPDFPLTLTAGDLLRLTRLDPSGELTMIRALAPVEQDDPGAGGAEPYATSTDQSGYITINNADSTTDGEGYQTLPDATATADPDGYESVERTS